ncbi:MAG: DUF4402 domain-containing protein [Pseudomonadales bacterium]
MKMKKLLTSLALVSGIGAMSGTALAIDTYQLTGTSDAHVIADIVMTLGDPMSFSLFTAGTGGTIDSECNVTGDVDQVTGTCTNGSASVTSEPSKAIDFTVSTPNILTHTVDATQTMSATSRMCSSSNENLSINSSTTGSDNICTVSTLTVAAAQLAGNYTGTFTFTARYQ